MTRASIPSALSATGLTHSNDQLIWSRERAVILPDCFSQAEQLKPPPPVFCRCYFGDCQSGRNDGHRA
jgi:hypothetical protein